MICNYLWLQLVSDRGLRFTKPLLYQLSYGGVAIGLDGRCERVSGGAADAVAAPRLT